MKPVKIILIIIIYLNCSIYNLFSKNTKLDSLRNIYNHSKHDTTRAKLLIELGSIYESTLPDTAIFLYQKALSLIEQNIKEKATNYRQLLSLKANALRLIGYINWLQSNYDISLEYYLKSLKNYTEIKDNVGISYSYNFIGLVYYDIGSYDKAVEYYLKSLKIMEELGDKNGMSRCYSNMGNVNTEQGNYDKALEFYLKSLKIDEELGDKNGISRCFNNIGTIHYYQDSYSKSLEYYLKSLDIFEKLGDFKEISRCYNNIGGVLFCQNNYNKAIEYYLKSMKIDEKLGDKNGISLCYTNLAILNITLADSTALTENQKINYLNNAIVYGAKALKIAHEIMSMPQENESAKILMEAYKKLGNFKKSIEYAEIYITTKDSMFSEEKTKSLAEMGAKYESEKRELTIQKLEKEQLLQNETIARKNAESKKQRILIFSFLAGFIIILVFSIFLYRLFIQKKKANIILSQQKEEISAQRDEIETQRDLVTEQKEHIEEIHKEVTDSINYAERIQRSFLATKELLDENLNSSLRVTVSPELSSKSQVSNFKNQEEESEKNYEHFDKLSASQLNIRTIEQSNQEQQTSNLKFERSGNPDLSGQQTSNYFVFFHPKDVVSGDFYWAGKLNNGNFALATADSTGHGVPGAIMSILNISSLEKAIESGLCEPAEILNHTRKTIIERLKKDGSPDGGKDGMDASLISFDFENKKLTYSAANNAIWIVRNTNLQGFQNLGGFTYEPEVHVTGEDASANFKPQTSNVKLFELTPDKMPIGKHDKDQISFTQQTFQLQKGDVIYTLTDGFPDQFGGPKGKKFMSKNLKQLLIANCHLTMEEQKQVLEKTLVDWIGKGEQIDDITIIGIKI